MRARAERNGYKNGTKFNGLASQVVYGLLPTPLANMSNRKLDENGENTSHTTGKKYSIDLNQLAEAGMLPTPTRSDYNTPRSPEAWERAKEKHGDALQVPLKQLAANGMLPTPIAGDWKGQRRADGTASMLSGKASLGMLPTPTAQEFRDSQLTTEQAKKLDKGGRVLRRLGTLDVLPAGTSSQLNPRFVAEMMGFPVNWTELPFQSGEPSQSKPTETP
jgi:hypothetical protein